MTQLDPSALLAIFVALALGGTLKGATGMGAPVIAIPVMASFFDVRLAVVLMVLPNLITNGWQLWIYRRHRHGPFGWLFALAGAAGSLLGTGLLATVPARALTLTVAAAVTGYVVLRLLRRDLRLSEPRALQLVLPLGALAGTLQGAAGISAPVSVSFLNARRLDRQSFIPTISLFFAAMCLVQIPALFALGFYDRTMLGLSLAALLPLLAFMPIGAFLARSISSQSFDRLTLCVLAGLAVKLIVWP